jgi:hypothetical protein
MTLSGANVRVSDSAGVAKRVEPLRPGKGTRNGYGMRLFQKISGAV